jgi:hypothetical protein
MPPESINILETDELELQRDWTGSLSPKMRAVIPVFVSAVQNAYSLGSGAYEESRINADKS